ncbi:MAG: hypothetical protein A2Z96_04940 [Spirochaetes bacterium GWB1_48_6]|nr:MAG: hypothetical protein A2Z96_04940 [Spirochaetes bacterium GWB1_48_6]
MASTYFQTKNDPREVRKRTRHILALLVKHGFGSIFGKKVQDPEESYTKWSRVRLLLEDLGPTYIKLGQIFSNRTDILPENLILELRKLQDRVPPIPQGEALKILELEMGKPWTEIFSEFDQVPLASASIAQVHKARLLSGQNVAVKIQRPRIEQIISMDMEVLGPLGLWVEKLILRSDVINTKAILDEFSKTIHRELDFKTEAIYMEKFQMNFKDEKDIYSPKLHKNLSTHKILIMEYIQGIYPLDFDSYQKYGLDRKEIARKGADLILKQIFVHGFFHADPHPGNILILEDGKICFLDFGMMGILYEKHREKLAGMLLAVGLQNPEALAQNLKDLSLNSEDVSVEELEQDVHDLLETYSHLPLKDINLTAFLNQAMGLLLAHKLEMPPALYLLLKALITTEGLARNLDPDFDMLSAISPFVQRIFAQRLNPTRVATQGAESAMDYFSLFHELPGDIKELVRMVKKGRLKMEFDAGHLDVILHKADRISNRLSFSLIVTGAVVASSLALSSPIPPLWNGIPIIAIVGFVGAGIMAFALLISIWRSGKM